jgi:hypothetical protein
VTDETIGPDAAQRKEAFSFAVQASGRPEGAPDMDMRPVLAKIAESLRAKSAWARIANTSARWLRTGAGGPPSAQAAGFLERRETFGPIRPCGQGAGFRLGLPAGYYLNWLLTQRARAGPRLRPVAFSAHRGWQDLRPPQTSMPAPMRGRSGSRAVRSKEDRCS